MDSLQQKGLSTANLNRQLDSLNQLKPLRYADSLQQQLTNLQQKINNPLQKAEGSVTEKLNRLGAQGSASALTDNINLPEGTLPGNVPTIPSVNVDGSTKELLPEIGKEVSMPKEVDALKEVSSKLEGVSEVTDKVTSYQSDLSNIKENGLQQSKELPKLAEDKVGEVAEVGFIKEQAGKMNLSEGGMMGEDAAKDMVKEQVKTEATKLAKDHFAGKQEALMGAMQKLTDLKEKYASLDSLNVPKRRPNAMKGKALKERLVPGLTLQVQKSQYWLVDFNPSVAYRITGRWNAGIGWNQRIGFAKRMKTMEQEKVYGSRIFTEFRWNKGFSFRLEAEKLYGIPSPSFGAPKNAEAPSRWINSAFLGMKKDYRISNRLRGNIQLLYLIYDDNYSSPYAEKLNTRMGLEYTFRAIKKNEGK